MKTCNNCGNEIRNKAVYCDICGNFLGINNKTDIIYKVNRKKRGIKYLMQTFSKI